MIKKVKFLLLSILMICFAETNAQVTTSGMSGKVEANNESVIGASVVATHVASGTTYGSVTNMDGRFSLVGMRTGGPYKVEIKSIGYGKYVKENIFLQLGENYVLNATLTESETILSEVVITGRGSKFAGEKNGSMTNINSRDMALVPTISRGLSDLTKLSPYSSGSGSFGGRPAYATNISVDGANFNNNFGLNSNTMPGPSSTSADPISMDVVEEIQVAVAPYDVRQSNFTGANVNVVTKSGTNKLHGSAYYYFRNQKMNGTKIEDKELTVNESERQIYGLTLGGPILKNKLFFFVSGELENNLTPGNTLLAGGAGRDPKDPNVNKNVTGEQMQYFSDLLKNKFGYNTGRYESWGGDNEGSKKLLAKLDWNIDKNNKATVRYNYSKSSSVSRPSSSGDARPTISGSRHSSTGGMSFENSQYRAAGSLQSVTAELNSKLSNAISNKFLAAYTSYSQPREYDGGFFPFIDILDGDATKANVRMSAGTELFSYENAVKNNTLILTDNLSYQMGNHTITGGVSYENQYVSNSYIRQGSGYYRFKNIQAFEKYINGEGVGKAYNSDYHPLSFAFTYPINGNTKSLAELGFGQFSLYGQDEWDITKSFKLTYGLRVDLPMYHSGAVDNPALANFAFRDGEKVDLSTWPKTRILWSPRIGFNYDVTEDKSIKLRGGLGIFTGRIPFVWFVNQPQNSGMLQYQLVINNGKPADNTNLSKIPFAANPYDLLKNESLSSIFPQSNPASGRIAFIDKDFRLPQVARASLAADFRLPAGMVLTLEGIYTKDLNAIKFDNINLQNAESTLKEGNLERPYWSNANKYITSPYTDVVKMTNTNKGYGYLLSAQLSIPEYYGFSGNIAYAYSHSEEVTGKNGSDPFSAWQYRHVTSSLNSDEMGLTFNNTPHRFTVGANYQIEYLNHMKSTFSLFYTGNSGNSYSYIYSADANKDGTVSDLMYIPKSKDDFIWTNGDADADAYFAFAAQDPYLSKNAGKYAQRYAAYMPFYNRLDFRFLQDFYIDVAGQRNTLQLSFDFVNFLNMFNSNWGINKLYIGSNNQVTPLKFDKIDAATGKASVSMTKINKEYMTTAFQNPGSVSATWNLQIGLKYIF